MRPETVAHYLSYVVFGVAGILVAIDAPRGVVLALVVVGLATVAVEDRRRKRTAAEPRDEGSA